MSRSAMPQRAANSSGVSHLWSDADLAHISPLAFGHIIPNGTYWFERDLQIPDPG